MVSKWSRRTGSDGEIHEMTVEDKLDLLAESVMLLAETIAALSVRSGNLQSIAKQAALEQLWADAE